MRTAKTLAAAVAATAALGAATTAEASAASTIRSPTGNIVCTLATNAKLLRDVKSDGLGVSLRADGTPRYTSPFGLRGGMVVGDGRTITSKHFRCTSTYDGMRCVERHTGEDVFLSRGGGTYRF